MSDPSRPPSKAAAISAAASDWIARRDRGLQPGEQDAFLQWLREDPRHRAELARLDLAWGLLDGLAEWRPAHSTRPNPDLLRVRPVARRRGWWYGAGSLAAAAALAVGAFFLRPAAVQPPPAVAGVRIIPAPEALALPDGSSIAANRGAIVVPAFTAGERHVRLIEGEAHFRVAKDSTRPFVVEAVGVAVRAVGTAFNVRLAAGVVDVLVTAGEVRLEPPPSDRSAAGVPPPTSLRAGEQALFDPAHPQVPPVVVTLSPAQIEHALAWQAVRLDFDDLPLAAVVAEFNVRNHQQLVIGDPQVAGLRIAGRFRADNAEAFARLLVASFNIAVERRADGALVLRRAE